MCCTTSRKPTRHEHGDMFWNAVERKLLFWRQQLRSRTMGAEVPPASEIHYCIGLGSQRRASMASRAPAGSSTSAATNATKESSFGVVTDSRSRGSSIDAQTKPLPRTGSARTMSVASAPEEVHTEADDAFDPQLLDPPGGGPFDPVAYVNARFPDEASLAEVEPFAVKLDGRVARLDLELAEAVKSQAQLAGKALADLDAARKDVGELHARVKGIRSKAEDSEARVEAVCRDITKLDRAQTNLQSTMTALKRAVMLLGGIDQLEFLATSKQYTDAARILGTVNELNAFFEPYDHVPKIKEMRHSVALVRDQLTKNIFEDVQGGLGAVASFDSALDGNGNPDDGFYSDGQSPEALRGACMVADLLSASTRNSLCKTLTNEYLKAYDDFFRVGGEDSGLEKSERRFAWLRRMLEANKRVFSDVFPPSWRMEEQVVVGFATRTSAAFATMLASGTYSQGASQVGLMMKALKKTLEYEADMMTRFPPDPEQAAPAPAEGSLGPASKIVPPTPRVPDMGSNAQAAGKDATDPPWMISKVFAPYMGALVRVLIDSVREQVDNAMVEELVEATTTAQQQPQQQLRVFSSSAQLFQAIKNALNTMREFSTGQPFLDLTNELKTRLIVYADALEKRAVGESKSLQSSMTSNSAQASGAAPRGATGLLPPSLQFNVAKPLDQSSARFLCLAVNTAVYMAEEIPQLAKHISRRIDPNLAAKVDFENARERFYDCASRVMVGLASRLVTRMEPWLEAMSKTNWLTFKDPGDRSIYVRQVHSSLADTVPIIGKTIQNQVYFRSFCDAFAGSFLKSYAGHVAKIRRVGEMGAQQLLVDAKALEVSLLEIPALGESSVAVTTYKRFIEHGMKRHKVYFTILNTQAPAPIFIEQFVSLMGSTASIALLNAIMDVRGMTKPGERLHYIKLAEDAKVPATSPDDVLLGTPSAEGGSTGVGGRAQQPLGAGGNQVLPTPSKKLSSVLFSSMDSVLGSAKLQGPIGVPERRPKATPEAEPPLPNTSASALMAARPPSPQASNPGPVAATPTAVKSVQSILGSMAKRAQTPPLSSTPAASSGAAGFKNLLGGGGASR